MSADVPESLSVFPFPFSKVREEQFSFIIAGAAVVLAEVLPEAVFLEAVTVEALP